MSERAGRRERSGQGVRSRVLYWNDWGVPLMLSWLFLKAINFGDPARAGRSRLHFWAGSTLAALPR